MARRPFSTPGNMYPQISQASEDGTYSSAPQSPQHNGTPYETASELSVYQSALDVTDTHPTLINDRPTILPINGRPASVLPVMEETSLISQPERPNVGMYFRDKLKRIDFVLAYSTADSLSQEERNSEARRTFEENLRNEGLILEHEAQDGRKVNFVKIHVPWEVVTRYAEIMKFKMPMKRLEKLTQLVESDAYDNPIGFSIAFSQVSMFPSLNVEVPEDESDECDVPEGKSFYRRLLNIFTLDPSVFPHQTKRVKAEFNREKQFLFQIPSNRDEFFNTSQRSQIVDFILKRKRFSGNQNHIFAFGITRLLADGIYTDAFPLHEGQCGSNRDASDMRSVLRREWASLTNFYKFQPLDAIKEYFGVTCGLYFAWLGFYTYMLIPASIVGLACFLYGCITINTFVPSKDICGSNSSIIMCPVCDRCQFWKVEDTCSHSRITSIVDNPAIIVFAVFMSFWGALFLEMWKRYSSRITYQWDLTGFDQNEEHPRPEYLAKLQHVTKRKKVNRITGIAEPYISFWSKKFPAVVMSMSAVLLLVIFISLFHTFGVLYIGFIGKSCLCCFVWLQTAAVISVNLSSYLQLCSFENIAWHFMSASYFTAKVTIALAAVIGVIFYRMSVTAALSLQSDSGSNRTVIDNNIPIITTSTAACINLVFILVLNRIYGKVAEYLTELEIPRTQTNYDDSLTLKMFLLQFVNYYASIFYIAFFKGKFIGYPGNYERLFGYRQEECGPGGCLMELSIQLAIIMVGKQALNAFIEMFLPVFYGWLRVVQHKITHEIQPEKAVTSWERDFHLVDLGPLGLFWEYLEMILQFGFVTIFVTAFPLAPLFALLNNIFETRLDAMKFLNFYRRPVSRRIRSIGVWYRIMDCLGKISVITNAFIIAFTSNFIPSLVYRYTLSPDGSLQGYLNFSLSYFSVKDFENQYKPIESDLSENLTYCRYNDFRNPPWVEDKYKASFYFWQVLVARLAFVIVFENVVMLSITLLRWLVPDVPRSVQQRLRHDAYLTNEVVIEHEYMRARRQVKFERLNRRDVGTMVKEFDLSAAAHRDKFSSRASESLV